MAKLLSVGEMVIDFLPGSEEGSYIRKAGGAPANVAIAVARQGCAAAFCGMMGNDDFGRFLYNTLEENHVEPVVKELTDRAITTMAFVSLDAHGDRSFTFARKPGADMFLEKVHLTDEVLDGATVIHAGSCSLSAGTAAEATVYALEEGHKRGKLVSFDVNYRNLMWHDDQAACAAAVMDILPFVDLLKISDEEAEMMGGEENIPALMQEKNITLVIETLGSKGARFYWNGIVDEVPTLKANCVDTCGAGDAFWGGFLTTLMKAGVTTPAGLTEELLRSAMEHGNIAGWLCVQQKGAIESLPTAEAVEHYWEANYNV
ncbi:MAG: carbohydrate kinase [Ruminococcaceae bacterium]|nr:carbohydrate kinase [Oscillospiraceae bacterium]